MITYIQYIHLKLIKMGVCDIFKRMITTKIVLLGLLIEQMLEVYFLDNENLMQQMYAEF